MQKIGESTLLPFSKSSSGELCSHDYVLRLFGLKGGLQSYCVDENDRKIMVSDCGGIDTSYQLDRRGSEPLLTMWAQKLGINIYHGVGCSIELPHGAGQAVTRFDDNPSTASIYPPQTSLKHPMRPSGTTTNRVNARLVCDVSDFSRSLTGKFGRKEKLGPWDCYAYWAYFKQKPAGSNVDKRLLKWEHPAPKHRYFPEGWG